MKKLLLLAALTYVLPKEKPLYEGMIVRCESFGDIKPQPNGHVPSVSHCHWECEFGETIETYIEDGNQKTRANGCATEQIKGCVNDHSGITFTGL